MTERILCVGGPLDGKSVPYRGHTMKVEAPWSRDSVREPEVVEYRIETIAAECQFPEAFGRRLCYDVYVHGELPPVGFVARALADARSGKPIDIPD